MDGLPSQNYYELCAVYLLEYEKIMKDNKTRHKELKDVVKKSPDKIDDTSEKKMKKDKYKLRKKVCFLILLVLYIRLN